jgi:hypothetical protein
MKLHQGQSEITTTWFPRNIELEWPKKKEKQGEGVIELTEDESLLDELIDIDDETAQEM